MPSRPFHILYPMRLVSKEHTLAKSAIGQVFARLKIAFVQPQILFCFLLSILVDAEHSTQVPADARMPEKFISHTS